MAHLYGKSRGILCGVPFFDGASFVCHLIDRSIGMRNPVVRPTLEHEPTTPTPPTTPPLYTQYAAVFYELGCSVEWHLQEGDAVDPSSAPDGKVVVATVKGGARQVLLGERTALNILTRASGIATQVL